MSYKEWPFKEAERIAARLQRRGKNEALAQTGYGPSGLPHIGTFGEVARTSFVLQALAVVAPGVPARIVSFSDDLDGLREAPANIPNREMILPYLGMPLTSIPDPFGQEPSYAHYMNKKLREFLDSFGFEYEFVSSTDVYQGGKFNEGLRRILRKREKITQMFVETISEEKRATWSPFFPVCEKCGRVYSTRVTAYHDDTEEVSYVCDTSSPGKYEACGHQGRVSVLDGKCKVGWKVDWALRWFTLGVDYEMHGEDLMESARLSSKIVREIGGHPPELFKYELFLDETGRKISKKIGNGVSIEQWLRYGPVDSLLYFMYLKPQQGKRMGLPLLPKIIDGYLELMAKDTGEADSPAQFVRRLSHGPRAGALSGENVVTYSLIYDLLIALSVTDPEVVKGYLLKYQPQVAENLEYYEQLIREVITYYTEVYLPNRHVEEPGHAHDAALSAFECALEGIEEELTPEIIQNAAFQAAKEREIPMKEWFTTLYRLFLGQPSGPKVGTFIALIGVDRAMEKLRAHLGEGRQAP